MGEDRKTFFRTIPDINLRTAECCRPQVDDDETDHTPAVRWISGVGPYKIA